MASALSQLLRRHFEERWIESKQLWHRADVEEPLVLGRFATFDEFNEWKLIFMSHASFRLARIDSQNIFLATLRKSDKEKLNAAAFINHSAGNFIYNRRWMFPMMWPSECVNGIEIGSLGESLFHFTSFCFCFWIFIDFPTTHLDYYCTLHF